MGSAVRRRLYKTYTKAILKSPLPAGPFPHLKCDGHYGAELCEVGGGARPLRMVLLGDSLALSVGCSAPGATVGATLAESVVRECRRPVRLEVHARLGTDSRTLHAQVTTVLRGDPGLALISVGGNDALAPGGLRACARRLARQIARLRAGGWQTGVGTCPQLGGLPALRPFVRGWAGRRGHRLARLQTVAALRAGAHTVNLLDPRFLDPAPELMHDDGFHPSGHGYALYLRRLAPVVHALVRQEPAADTKGACLPLQQAVPAALRVPGAVCVPAGPGMTWIQVPEAVAA
ncbi:SGNH/GDSL hydrolase family protein [Streptomyces aurantiacus]|uniref:SGNH hydrolase-type esterase domain-containing protein n=1 Tax=Streptomyces aurantiacus JA 4570 TaxID=1286094 RepID=S4A5U0_9ACTN|nr:SGNH/GDSL hydrolase family protein [Streptomyces aurantiacus]EPH46080.1 hypothetical protein STRAU_0816 [Streptomyces aurantiacus JA 4570]